MPNFPIETMRHSAAHVVAASVMELHPQAKLGVGPVVENGFYYDIDFGVAVTDTDLAKIEARAREIVKRNDKFTREEMPIDEAIAFFKKRGQVYKVELLQDLKKRGTTKMSGEELQDVGESVEKVSVYHTGNFVDLCRGPHVEHAGQIGAFALNRLSGAYWRGKDTNPQLTRIYGLCFANEKELKAHLAMLEEAKKRDHKKLGVELDLFTFSDLVGSGLPLWTPRGTVMRNILDNFVWELRQAAEYVRVEIPHITKKDLYERSGHWEKFKDELFKITTREGHIFAMKPMNCPHHTQIYARRQHSYRELPQRFANTTMVYRDEQTGELSGLSRVRSITQDDAHVFCRYSQVKGEILKIWDIVTTFYAAVGFTLRVRLSLHDAEHPEKYLGTGEVWETAEKELREIIALKKVTAEEAPGEAAFYGPKIDFLGKDSLGREWQVATIQLDMNLPERFDLSCVNEAGQPERIVMIHAAIMGSIERYLSIIIEHFAGAFPVWLSPVQVKILPVGEGHRDFAQLLAMEMRASGVRVMVDMSDETVGKKIRLSEQEKVPYMLVVGDKEMKEKILTVRRRGEKEMSEFPLHHFIEQVLMETKTRRDGRE